MDNFTELQTETDEQADTPESGTSSAPRILIEHVALHVAAHFNIPNKELKSKKRTHDVARPRQIGFYLARSITGKSYPEIGKRFGGFDHTTVLHGLRKVEDKMAADKAFATLVNGIKDAIYAHAASPKPLKPADVNPEDFTAAGEEVANPTEASRMDTPVVVVEEAPAPILTEPSWPAGDAWIDIPFAELPAATKYPALARTMEHADLGTTRDLYTRMDKALEVKIPRLRALLVECTINPTPLNSNPPFEAVIVAHILRVPVTELFARVSRTHAAPYSASAELAYG